MGLYKHSMGVGSETFHFTIYGVVKPEYIPLVGTYLERKEWPVGEGLCSAWHAWLAGAGRYTLVDAYMYYDDWPAYERAELDRENGGLVLKFEADYEWTRAFTDLLLTKLCEDDRETLRIEYS